VPDTNGVYIEFYDDEITLQEVSDTEYFEIFDEGFSLNVMAAENVVFSHNGLLEVLVGSAAYPIVGGTFTIIEVAAMVTDVPTGSAVKVDVNKNDVTIYGTQNNRPTIAIGARIAVVGANSVTSVTDGDYLSVDIDEIGSGSPGSFLTVVIRLQRVA